MSVKNPLAEVFGFPINNLDKEANRYRKNKLCPYNNKVPSCTKDKVNDPLGVCSAISQFCRNLTGQVIAISSLSNTEQTPNGSFTLSFVHDGTLLL